MVEFYEFLSWICCPVLERVARQDKHRQGADYHRDLEINRVVGKWDRRALDNVVLAVVKLKLSYFIIFNSGASMFMCLLPKSMLRDLIIYINLLLLLPASVPKSLSASVYEFTHLRDQLPIDQVTYMHHCKRESQRKPSFHRCLDLCDQSSTSSCRWLLSFDRAFGFSFADAHVGG